ncbi:ArsR family transcriptional regulator [Actinomycetes bacterium KLBMP 9759]
MVAPDVGRVSVADSRVRIDPRAAVRVVFDPYGSVLALACAAVRDRQRGLDTRPARIAARMSERGFRAIAPLVAPGASLGPDCLSPEVLGQDTDVAAEVDRLRAMTAADVASDIDATFGGAPPERWQRMASRSWARDVGDVLESLWTAVEPVWRRESDLRAREADRIGVAAARQSLEVVLAQAHPRGRAEDSALVFPDPEAVELDATGRAVVLSPLLSKLDVSLSNLERPDMVWFAYPVLDDRKERSDAAALAALLTQVRADLLRFVARDRTMTDVRAGLSLGASVATYHVDALVAYGLVSRHRAGRTTLVRRTPRGAALIDLYGG